MSKKVMDTPHTDKQNDKDLVELAHAIQRLNSAIDNVRALMESSNDPWTELGRLLRMKKHDGNPK